MDLSHPFFGPLYALAAGILSSASPCALAAIPLVMGHMSAAAPGSGRRARLMDLLLFLFGMAAALTVVGVIAGALGKSLILTAPWIRWGAGLAFIAAGASYLGLIGGPKTCSVPLVLEARDAEERPGGAGEPARPNSRSIAVRRAVQGLMMGGLYGLSASPCSTPALLAILALVAAAGSVARGAVLLLAYSVGQSAIVAAAGLATSRFQAVLGSRKGLQAVESLRKLGGATIIGFGVYLLLRPYL